MGFGRTVCGIWKMGRGRGGVILSLLARRVQSDVLVCLCVSVCEMEGALDCLVLLFMRLSLYFLPLILALCLAMVERTKSCRVVAWRYIRCLNVHVLYLAGPVCCSGGCVWVGTSEYEVDVLFVFVLYSQQHGGDNNNNTATGMDTDTDSE